MLRTCKMLLLASLITSLAGSCIKKNDEVLNTPYTKLDFTSAVETQTFELYSNFLWNIEITDPWLTVTPAKGYGDKQLTVSVAANTDLNARQASFFIVGENTRKEISISQAGESPVLQLDVTKKSIDANGGALSVELTTNLEVAVTSDVSWIQLSTTRTVATQTYSFTVEPNTTLSERSGNVQFKQTDGQLSALLTITQTGETPAVQVAVDTLVIPYTGGQTAFDVTSNIKWEASSNVEWLVPDATKLMETVSCRFVADTNVRVEPRMASITVKASDYPDMSDAVVPVRQEGAPATMVLSNDTLNGVPAAGQTLKVMVEANFDWKADVSQTAEWISNVISTSDAIEIKVNKNEDITPRSTVITLVQNQGDYTKSIIINQLPGKSSLTLPAQSAFKTVAAEGGVLSIPVLTNVTWTAEVSKDWVRVVSTKGIEEETLMLEFDPNPDAEERAALLVVTTTQDSIQSITRILHQAAAEAVLTTSNDTINVTATAGSYTTQVYSNISWAVQSKPEWISSTTIADGSDAYHKTLAFTVAANANTQPRSGKIVLYQIGGTLTATIVVNQAAEEAYVNASVSYTQALDNEGDTFMLSVTSNIQADYYLPDSPSWLQLTNTNTEGRTTTYSFTVQQAVSASSRDTRLQVTNPDRSTVYKSFTVIQKGARISHSDSLALVQFYNNTNGATWRDTYVWNLLLPATTWKGVTLEENPRADGAFHVKRLELSGARLVGTIGDVVIAGVIVSKDPLSVLKYIEVINLSSNSGLVGSLPPSWAEFSFLETLNLADCNLVNSVLGGFNIPKQYGDFSNNLTVLKVNGNLLTGTIPQEVVDHHNFDTWDFDKNIKPQKTGELVLP